MVASDSDSPNSAASGYGDRPAHASTTRRNPPDPPHLGRSSESSSLLNTLNTGARPESYEHGTFTPGMSSRAASTGTDFPTLSDDDEDDEDFVREGAGLVQAEEARRPSWRARLSRGIKTKKVRNSRVLAREAGVEYSQIM